MPIATEITVAVIGATASVIAALVGRASEKKRPKPEPKASATPRPALVFTAIIAVGLALTAIVIAIFWPRPGPSLPVGSVISFWGTSNSIPNGYELCDGELVTTPGSPIHKTRKPDLRDHFIKGAKKDVPDVVEKPETGGTDVLDLKHSHSSGELFACITQQAVSFHDFDIPLVTRGTFNPTNGGFRLGGTTASATRTGGFSGKEDNMPNGTAVDGFTAEALTKPFDNRPTFVSLYFIIKVL